MQRGVDSWSPFLTKGSPLSSFPGDGGERLCEKWPCAVTLLSCQNESVTSVCVCYRVDARERRIRHKCLGPVEWRPDVDGKMGKNWIPHEQLIFCSLLILVGTTKHGDIQTGGHC